MLGFQCALGPSPGTLSVQLHIYICMYASGHSFFVKRITQHFANFAKFDRFKKLKKDDDFSKLNLSLFI